MSNWHIAFNGWIEVEADNEDEAYKEAHKILNNISDEYDLVDAMKEDEDESI